MPLPNPTQYSWNVKNSGSFIICVFAIYLITAYNSSGYHHEDEHYQIIEFANYKLGLLPANRLAWEYQAEIRPGFQPLICFILLKNFYGLGITDGYYLAFIFRAISAILAIFVISKFVEAYKSSISLNLQPYFIFLSYLLWFLPYINIRFSSECWSGLSFLMALAAIQWQQYGKSSTKYIIVGLFIGISILFRYQSILLGVGLILWLILIQKIKLSCLMTVIFTIFIILCLGVAADYWLYGNLTVTIYNYLNVNVIKGVSASFGVSPIYEYIYYVLTAPGLFGIFIILSFLILFYFDPKNILLWVLTPFILVHSLIPHKELRFLFPIANLVPLLLVQGYQKIPWKTYSNTFKQDYKYPVVVILLLLFMVNSVGLVAIASTGAGTKKTVVTEWIHKNYEGQKLNIIIVDGNNPYMDWGPPKNSYYSSSSVTLTDIQSIWQDNFLEQKKPGYTNLLIISDNDITGKRAISLFQNLRLVKVYQNIPEYLNYIYQLYDPDLNDLALNVYEYK